VVVSERDQAKMARIGEDLALGVVDHWGSAEQRSGFLRLINEDRVAHGFEPLDDRPPEEGLYERARSLGMARIDR
ncbi:MAG: hypothetical protein ACKV2O_24480, partial [Acidimicrobiales bacterium]